MAKRKSTESADAQIPSTASEKTEYTVVARRYRPQQFQDLVGQEPVVQALRNALAANRVAHAYLFTGARGVGKTSTARILAKCLNCSRGPTADPCGECEICKSITSGEDVDVLEIDGASNRGIDEIREIRQNVQYRPTRSRYKIYIVDEVHMLTAPAFNALLKTLEEPPPHVKFIFATTEVQKIPVTILSRCQRFDFAGIGSARIVERLRDVVAHEGMSAEDDALELIARRAGGSMRDAQSLLDQVLAFGGDKLTSDVVHQLLGTAHDDRVLELASAVLNGDAKSALEILGRGADEGLQLGELLDQLLEYWRDLMVVSCSGIAARNLSIPQRHRETLAKQAGSLGLDVILAGMDVLSSAKARLRQSSHTRVILEMAIVRLSRLDDLISLAQIAQTLDQPGQSQGSSRPAPRAAPPVSDPPNAPVKKKLSDSLPDNVRTEATKVLSPDSLTAIWKEVRAQAGPFLSRHLEPAGLPAILGPNALVIRFAAEYNSECEHCQQPASVGRIEELLRKVTGQAIAVRIESLGGGASRTNGMAVAASEEPSRYHRQRSEALKEPLVKGAVELLAAQLMEVDERFGCEPTEPEPTEKAETEES